MKNENSNRQNDKPGHGRDVLYRSWRDGCCDSRTSMDYTFPARRPGPFGQACVGSNEDRIVRFEHSVTLRVTSVPGSSVTSALRMTSQVMAVMYCIGVGAMGAAILVRVWTTLSPELGSAVCTDDMQRPEFM
jgi:hypothetical protein